MEIERRDIDLVMKSFGCDETTATSLIKCGINLHMLREGIDEIVEPELHLKDDVQKMAEKLTESVAQFKKDS